MASYTPNLNLYKPDDSDDYVDFRAEFNSNMNILDQSDGNQNLAEAYDDTATYAVGDYVIYDGLLYKCDTAVATAETFDPTKWTHVLVTDEMSSGGGGGGGGSTKQIAYLKWQITKVRGSSPHNGCMQMQEFYLSQAGSIYAWNANVSVSSNMAGVSSSYDADKIVDGNLSTKYCTNAWGNVQTNECNIVISLGETITLTSQSSYSFVTGDDETSRDPVSWKLYGSLDGTTWDELDSRDDVDVTTSRRTRTNEFFTNIQGGGSSGHTIYDKDGTALAQESGLQFTGAVSVSDDSVNGRTVVDVEGGGNYYLNTLYSTEEKKIGYWTDGKPLYQKTIDCGALPNNTTKTIAHNISNIDYSVIIRGSAKNPNNGIEIPLPYVYGNTRCLQTYINDTNIVLISTENMSVYTKSYVTIQYTKTTDTADLNPQIGNVIYLPTIYSEEERQIGVWTDGKPLYQKTITVNSVSLPATDGVDVLLSAYGINDVEKIIDIKGRDETVNAYIPYLSQSGNTLYLITISSDNPLKLRISRNGGAISNQTFVITVQYTKTTDTAGSGDWTPSGVPAVHYSTSEHVIGTWIDGKPLYEKTFTGLSQATSGTAWIVVTGTDIANLKEIINADVYGLSGENALVHMAIAEYTAYQNKLRIEMVSNTFDRTITMATIQYTKTTD